MLVLIPNGKYLIDFGKMLRTDDKCFSFTVENVTMYCKGEIGLSSFLNPSKLSSKPKLLIFWAHPYYQIVFARKLAFKILSYSRENCAFFLRTKKFYGESNIQVIRTGIQSIQENRTMQSSGIRYTRKRLEIKNVPRPKFGMRTILRNHFRRTIRKPEKSNSEIWTAYFNL